MKRLFFIIFIFCLSSIVSSQSEQNNRSVVVSKTDTLDIHPESLLILHFPSKAVKTYSAYDNGFYISYFIPSDTCMFSVFSGRLSAQPFITGSGCIVIDSIRIEDVFFDRRGFCLESHKSFAKKRGFFREKEFHYLSFSVKYEWVTDKKIAKYDKILDELEFIPK